MDIRTLALTISSLVIVFSFPLIASESTLPAGDVEGREWQGRGERSRQDEEELDGEEEVETVTPEKEVQGIEEGFYVADRGRGGHRRDHRGRGDHRGHRDHRSHRDHRYHRGGSWGGVYYTPFYYTDPYYYDPYYEDPPPASGGIYFRWRR